MTTGYDCEDVINIALMKPVFSPSDFIQMKGRGTRKHNFLNNWIDKNNQPYLSEPDKVNFKFFDFFGNCEYFEEKFDYDQKLKLPSASERKNDGDTPPMDFDEYVNINPDPLKTLKEIKVGEAGMRIDREAFEKFKEISKSDDIIEKLSAENNWEEMEKYLNENVFDKPTEFFNLDKLRNILGVDRKISVKELIEYSQGKITGIKSKEEIIEDEYEKFDNEYVPEEESYSDIKDLFKSYLSDPELQDILETKQYAKLNMHPAGETFKRTPEKFRQLIPDYIKKNKLTSLIS
jgi:type I restriction enzyme R subunit